MMTITALLPTILSVWVSAQPLANASVFAVAPAAESGPSKERRASYDAAQKELGKAEVQGDDDPGPASCERLEAALSAVEQYGDLLVDDDEGRETWMYARLTLVRNYYSQASDNARANALLEDTLRTVVVPKHILAKFRPYFGKQVKELQAKLDAEGKAKIRVVCHTECSVAVNRVPIETLEVDVYLGKHVVTVRSKDGSVESRDVMLELKKRGHVEEIEFGIPPEPEVTEPEPEPEPEPEGPEPEPEVTEPEPAPQPRPQSRRKVPRWVGITGTAVGVAVAVAGAVILSYDGKCPGGLDPVVDLPDCPKVFNAKPAGYGLIAGGAAMAGTFGAVLLPIGESRDRRARAGTVMLTYTFRF